MKILCLSKRRPQGKDLIKRPFGRFYNLPTLLSEYGHEVKLHLLSYTFEPEVEFKQENLYWTSRSLLKNPVSYLKTAEVFCEQWKPDWIIAFSDIWYGIMAYRLSSKYKVKFVIDAYDNYESYIPWAKPAHYLWRKSLNNADLITVAGPELGRIMNGSRRQGRSVVVPMAADNIFTPIKDKIKSRKKLGIPANKKIIGYCGSISHSRDIEILFSAITKLNREHPEIQLILSGRVAANVTVPKDAILLGYLPDEKIPDLIGCLDVLAVVNKDSNFGQHSYPVKLYEAMRCKIPLATTKTAATIWILRDHPEMLAKSSDHVDLARVLQNALKTTPEVTYSAINNWRESSKTLEEALSTHETKRP